MVTPTVATILASMLAIPTYPGDRHESYEERVELYTPVAKAIHDAARTAWQAEILVAIGRHESHFARYVLEGRCHEGPPGQRCDGGKSHGPWQVRDWCQAADMAGEARCVLSQFKYGYRQCSSYAGGFAALGGIRGCVWRGADTRIETVIKVRLLMATAARAEEMQASKQEGETPQAAND